MYSQNGNGAGAVHTDAVNRRTLNGTILADADQAVKDDADRSKRNQRRRIRRAYVRTDQLLLSTVKDGKRHDYRVDECQEVDTDDEAYRLGVADEAMLKVRFRRQALLYKIEHADDDTAFSAMIALRNGG